MLKFNDFNMALLAAFIKLNKFAVGSVPTDCLKKLLPAWFVSQFHFILKVYSIRSN